MELKLKGLEYKTDYRNSDDTYCENCGGVCDECSGGSTKKFPTEKEQADNIVKMIMSHGYTIANLVFEDLKEKIHAHLQQKNQTQAQDVSQSIGH